MQVEIGEGLRYLWEHPMIRALTLLGFGLSVSLGAVVGLLVVYGVRQLGLDRDDWRIGVLFSAGSAGALVASIAFPRLRRRVPILRISLTGFGVSWACMLAMAVSVQFEVALVAYFGFLAACQLTVINGIAYRQSATPDELRGRVNVVARMIAWGGQPFGAAIGGTLASAFGIRTALVAGSLGIGASFVIGLLGPLRRIDSTNAWTADPPAERPATRRGWRRGSRR